MLGMDLLSISIGVGAFVLGAAMGWVVARTRFTRLNSKLVLERRVNKQLREPVQIDAVPHFAETPDLTTSVEPAREPMVLSG